MEIRRRISSDTLLGSPVYRIKSWLGKEKSTQLHRLANPTVLVGRREIRNSPPEPERRNGQRKQENVPQEGVRLEIIVYLMPCVTKICKNVATHLLNALIGGKIKLV
jgi:hypothetical protein